VTLQLAIIAAIALSFFLAGRISERRRQRRIGCAVSRVIEKHVNEHREGAPQ